MTNIKGVLYLLLLISILSLAIGSASGLDSSDFDIDDAGNSLELQSVDSCDLRLIDNYNDEDLEIDEHYIRDAENKFDSNEDYPSTIGNENNGVNSDILNDGEKSFTELSSLIGGSDYISLDHDYKYVQGEDANGIIVNKNLVIEGKGHTIDGNHASRIFIVRKGITLTLSNLNIINAFCGSESNADYTPYKGSAIYSEGTLIVSNTNFINNSISNGSYFHFFSQYSDDIIDNQSSNGGAIYSAGDSMFADCSFIGNVGENGGAVFSTSASRFINCIFSSNTAKGGYNQDLSCQGDYHYIGGQGACIFSKAGCIIENCTFSSNNATLIESMGPGIVYVQSNTIIKNSSFLNNSADAAVYWLGDGSISNSSFENNSAWDSGGAIFVGGNATISNCGFRENHGANYGGAIYALGHFSENYNTGDYAYMKSQISILNSNFYNNKANLYGGALYLIKDSFVKNCTFVENYLDVEGYRKFLNETLGPGYEFYYNLNDAGNGGAVYLEYASVENSTFIGNNAVLNGGAVYSFGNASVCNSKFIDNVALEYGDNIYNKGNLTLGNNSMNKESATIYNNNFNGGGLITSPVDLVILDNKTYFVNQITNYRIYAKLIDDMGNLIQDYRILTIIDSYEQTTQFNNETGMFEYTLQSSQDNITISAIYEGASNINVKTSQINIGTMPSVISIIANLDENDCISFQYNEEVILNISLTDINGDVINETISMLVYDNEGNEIYSNEANAEGGVFELRLPQLAIGNYFINVSYSGSEDYLKSNLSQEFVISKIKTILTVDASDISFGEDVKINLKLTDLSQNNLNGTVLLYLNNGSYNVSIKEGIGSMVLSKLNSAIYSLDAQFIGDELYNSSYAKGSFKVNKLNSLLIAYNLATTTVNVKVDGKTGKYYTLYLMGSDGNLLSNRKVRIILNKAENTVTTDANGLAKLQINLANAGKYSIRISFDGDANYGSYALTKIITVKKQKIKMKTFKKTYKSSKKSKVLTVKLLSAKNKAIGGKKVTFIVNKKKYTAKTNKHGIAKVKVKVYKKKTYSYKIKFAGDKTYYALTKSAKLIVK